MNLESFIEYITSKPSELYLIPGVEIILYCKTDATVYLPSAARNNTDLNKFSEYGTSLGHAVLWSRQCELDCTSAELSEALINAGFAVALFEARGEYQVFALRR